jgi:F-type H+-transporting ATPase subunit a
LAAKVDPELDSNVTVPASRRDLTMPLIVVILVLAEALSILWRVLGFPVNSAPSASISSEILFTIPLGFANFYFTNSMLTTLIAAIVLVVFFASATRRMSIIPGRLQNLGEAIVEGLLGLVEGSAGKALGRRIFALIATIFLFVITANWMAIVPGWETIQVNKSATETISLLRPANADLNMTLAMAMIAFFTFQYYGVRAHGGGHFKEYFNPLHLIGDLARIISLSSRLFGNTFGGSVLVVVMYFLLGSLFVGFFTFVFLGLEMFFGLIQALLFSILTMSYIVLASAGGHEHEAESHPGPDFPLSKDEQANEAAASYG